MANHSNGQVTSKMDTTLQILRLLELSSEDAEFSAMTSLMACTQNFVNFWFRP